MDSCVHHSKIITVEDYSDWPDYMNVAHMTGIFTHQTFSDDFIQNLSLLKSHSAKKLLIMASKTNVAPKARSGRIGLDGWTSGQGYTN